MTEEAFITKYLDDNFTLVIGDKSLDYKEIRTGRILNREDFIKEFMLIFCSDDRNLSLQQLKYHQRWFDTNRPKILAEVDLFLSRCTLRLGRCNWVISHPNYHNPVEFNLFQERFKSNFIKNGESVFLTYYFSHWFNKEVQASSEKLMRYS